MGRRVMKILERAANLISQHTEASCIDLLWDAVD